MEERMLIENSHQAVTASEELKCQDGSSIEELILNFVKEKAARSQSQKTTTAYFETVSAFRTYLHERRPHYVYQRRRGLE